MSKRLKVWCGQAALLKAARPNGSLFTTTIVCAATKKRAVELLQTVANCNLSAHYFNGYWSETGNPNALAIATEEGIWVNQGRDFEHKYERFQPKESR